MTRLSILVVAVCLAIGFAKCDDDVLEDHNQSNEDVRRSGAPQQFQPVRPVPGANAVHPAKPVVPSLLLECYACQNCQGFSNTSTPAKICNPSFDPTRSKCVVYTEKYKHMSSPWVIRGCASERGNCADIKASHDAHSSVVELLSCDECTGDLCNSGVGKSLPSIAVAIIALLVTPLLAKSVLS